MNEHHDYPPFTMTDPSAPMTPATASRVVDAMRQAQRESQQLLEEFANIRRTSEGKRDERFSRILNVQEFILLVRFELAVLHEDIATPRGTLRANFYGRMLLLTIYESVKSLGVMLGPDFRTAAKELAPNVDLEARLRSIHSRINKLGEKSRKEYGDLRNGIVAHRDLDAEARMQFLERMGGSHVVDLAIELERLLTDLIAAMHTFWDDAATLPAASS